jgi:tRNA(Ile)-lysidine synthase TilS/MesJ
VGRTPSHAVALKSLSFYYPKQIKLHAVTLSLGFEGTDFTPVRELCERLRYRLRCRSPRSQAYFEERMEKKPVRLFSKMRRGALNELAVDLGIKKVALAHHFDDAVETFVMSLFFEGRIGCFEPVTYMSRTGSRRSGRFYTGGGHDFRAYPAPSSARDRKYLSDERKSKREEVKHS